MRVVVGEKFDDFFIGGAESGSGVVNTFAGKKFNNIGEEMNAETTDFGRALIFEGFVDKTGADDKVDLVVFNGFDKFFEIRNIMLAVGVELDGNVVIIVASIFIASLNSAADAEIIN